MAQPVDIRPGDLAIVQQILRDALPADAKVWVFGSRAKWTTKDSSDLDLAIDAGRKLLRGESIELDMAFEESDLPYKVDVVDWHSVADSFKAVIARDRVALPRYEEMRLGDFIEFQRGFDLPQQKRTSGKHPIVSSSGISDYHSESKVSAPGVVTGRYGTIGKVFYLDQPFWPLNTTLWVKDFKGNNPQFVYYFLHTLDFNSCADKSSVPGVNRNDLHLIPVQVPDADHQKAIVSVLSALDNKIELNRQMNETLEGMARALFKSWFVDFDPVRAKMEGRTPDGLSGDLAALFPDTLVDSPLGLIPKGWEVKRIEEVSRISIGRTPPRKEDQWFSQNPKDKKWVSIRDLGNSNVFIQHTSEFLTAAAVEKFNIPLIKKGTVMVSFKLTIGRVAIAAEDMYSNEAIAQFDTNSSNSITPEYLYCYLSNYDYGSLGSTSSIATAVNSKILREIKTLVAPIPVIEAFSKLAESAMNRIQINNSHNSALGNLRDTLLRKLISGDLRVADAAGALAEAV